MPYLRAGLATPLRLLLRARSLTALALGLALQQLFRSHDPRLRQAIGIAEAELRLRALSASLALDTPRLAAVPPRRRPRATTELARDILRFQDQGRLTSAETARRLGFTPGTLRRWRRRRQQRGELVLGPAQSPVPPNRRIDDPTRELVRACDRGSFEGKGAISRALAIVAIGVSKSAVGCIRREAPAPGARPAPGASITLLTSGERVKDLMRAHERRLRSRPSAAWPMPPPCPAIEFARRKDLHPRGRARRLLDLRDALHLALLEIVAPLRRAGADRLCLRLQRLHEIEAQLREQRRLVRARLAALAPHRRPHFTPPQRVEILLYKHSFRLSDEAVAKTCLLARQTLSRWNVAVESAPSRLLRPEPPLPDHDAALSCAAEILPAASEALRARIKLALARLCDTVPIAARKVGTPAKRAELPSRTPERGPRTLDAIRSRHPNHYWSVDLTFLRSLFGVYRPCLAVVLDLYSRYPLAWALWPSRPSSEDLASLLEEALRTWGPPEHLLVSAVVSDQGGEFTGEAFESALRRRGIAHLFGAVGQHGSIAVLERLWKTLKGALEVNDLPRLQFEDFERRLTVAIDWYARLRPHSSLKGATPRERYLRLRPACLDAQPAPRGRKGEPGTPHDTEIRYALADEKRLPYLVRWGA